MAQGASRTPHQGGCDLRAPCWAPSVAVMRPAPFDPAIFAGGPLPASEASTWPLSVLLTGEQATTRLAAVLATRLRPGDSVLLAGPIGAGKSALARALIRARLGDPRAEVPSPSFTLVQTYGEGEDEVWHADLHRLSGPNEVLELGLDEAMGRAICLIEWPDRLGTLAPASALRIDLAPTQEAESRCATLSGPEPWAGRLQGVAEGNADA